MGSIAGGLIAVALGILALITWPWRALEVFQGMIPFVLIIGGIVASVAGLEIVKEKGSRHKTEASDDKENE